MNEITLYQAADERANRYIETLHDRRVFPSEDAIANLRAFDEALSENGHPDEETLALLDQYGSPATTASNGSRYFGFVIGASLPAATAAERLMQAWDQCASSEINSPVSAYLESIAARWVLEILDLPRESRIGFGTSATACTLSCLASARRALLQKAGWDIDGDGLSGAPRVTVVVSETVHITVLKAIRLLGFGLNHIIRAPCDALGRINVSRLPALNENTILCLQAGEVNTGEFDTFAEIIPIARKAGAWVHIDGAFGLWARASALRPLTEGIESADSWTTDGHKWLNTPYDGAMAIVRNGEALAQTMNSDAAYSSASPDAQKNLTLEFSRRARGIPIWAALHSLGKRGVAEMVETHCRYAKQVGDALQDAGFTLLNRVVLNQVLFCADDEATTLKILERVQSSGNVWFGQTLWQGKIALRISISSWRTCEEDINILIATLMQAKQAAMS